MANGTCLCGATQYEISGPFNMMLHCHCSMCVSTARGIALVPAGSLDSDPGMRPLAHIYTSYKAPWFDITDSLLQHAGAPPAPNPSSAVNK
jgi:hypothetical protein